MRKTLITISCLLICGPVAYAYDFEGYIHGEVAGDQYGSSITTIDFNADTYPDLAISAPAADPAGLSSGKVYIYYGGPGADTIADLHLVGTASSFFGQALASAGDFNNDGYEDLLVGAPFYDSPASSAGAVFLYYGGPSPDTAVDHIFTGESGSDYFGISVSGVGDFNNDSYDDIAVGAYRADWGSFSDAGKTYVYYGGPSPDFEVDRLLVGTSDGERFGYAVTGADFNGDSFSDIAVGAYSYDDVFLNQGRVYVFFGGSSPDTVFDLSITGDSAGYKFGNALTTGLVNADVAPDLIMGTDGYSIDTFATGRLYVYYGGPGFDPVADDSYSLNRLADDYLGFALASGADIDADGTHDIVAGTPGNDDGALDAGGAVVIAGGAALSADTTIVGNAASEELGEAVGLWPWYGAIDTHAILIGASSYSNFTGRVYVFTRSSPVIDCCLMRGDVDRSDAINVADLTYLVGYLFKGGPPPLCMEEADTDSSGAINVSDLTYLVDYLFKGGPAPAPCP